MAITPQVTSSVTLAFGLNLSDLDKQTISQPLAQPYATDDSGMAASLGEHSCRDELEPLDYLQAENYLTPLVYQWNLNIQYEFLPTWVLELGYVGSRGMHQAVSNTQQINQAQLVGSPLGSNAFVAPAIAAGLVTTNTVSNASLRVPYLGFVPGGLTVDNQWRRQVQQPPGDRAEAILAWVAVSGSVHLGQVPHHGQPEHK
jgi:hypothetical protein